MNEKNQGVLSGRDARSDERQKPDVLELPDDLRIPLHGLQADAGYLIGRVADDASVSGLILQSLETRLSQVAEAAYRLNGKCAHMLAALQSAEKAIDDCLNYRSHHGFDALKSVRRAIAIAKEEPCNSPSGGAENAAVLIAAPTHQPTASSVETAGRAAEGAAKRSTHHD